MHNCLCQCLSIKILLSRQLNCQTTHILYIKCVLANCPTFCGTVLQKYPVPQFRKKFFIIFSSKSWSHAFSLFWSRKRGFAWLCALPGHVNSPLPTMNLVSVWSRSVTVPVCRKHADLWLLAPQLSALQHRRTGSTSALVMFQCCNITILRVFLCPAKMTRLSCINICTGWQVCKCIIWTQCAVTSGSLQVTPRT